MCDQRYPPSSSSAVLYMISLLTKPISMLHLPVQPCSGVFGCGNSLRRYVGVDMQSVMKALGLSAKPSQYVALPCARRPSTPPFFEERIVSFGTFEKDRMAPSGDLSLRRKFRGNSEVRHREGQAPSQGICPHSGSIPTSLQYCWYSGSIGSVWGMRMSVDEAGWTQ